MDGKPTEDTSSSPPDGHDDPLALEDVHVSSPNPHAPPSRTVSNIDMPKVKTGIFGASSNLVNGTSNKPLGSRPLYGRA